MRYEVKIAHNAAKLEAELNAIADRGGEVLTVLSPSGVKDPAWVVAKLPEAEPEKKEPAKPAKPAPKGKG